MKNSDYQKLPKNVRELYSSYSDNLFDDHPQVVSARRTVDEKEAEHQKANAVTRPLFAKRAALEARLEHAKAELQTQHDTRQKAVIAALVEDREIPAVDQGRENLKEIIEALRGAIDVVESELSRAEKRAQHASEFAADAAIALERTLERLKLEKAQHESY